MEDDGRRDCLQQNEKKGEKCRGVRFEQTSGPSEQSKHSSEGQEFINQNAFLNDQPIVALDQLIQTEGFSPQKKEKIDHSQKGYTLSQNKDNSWEFEDKQQSELPQDAIKENIVEREEKNLAVASSKSQHHSYIREKEEESTQKVRFKGGVTLQRRNKSRRNLSQFRNRRGHYNQKSQGVDQDLLPDRRRARPQCSISIYSTRMSLTMRRINQFKESFLVLPFRTLKFEFYPGSLIIQSKINYRERLRQKNLKDGQCSLQRVTDIAPIVGIGFIKVGSATPEEDYLRGLESLFINLRKIRETVYSLVICWDEGLGDVLKTLNKTVEEIERFEHKGETLREVCLNTIQPHIFSSMVAAFQRFTSSSFEEEGLWID